MCASKLYMLASGPWRDYWDWIGMVGKLASIVCLVQGSCQGMMGNKDIIECKLSQRAHEEERLHKELFFNSSFWWQHCVVPTTYSLSQTAVPRGLRAQLFIPCWVLTILYIPCIFSRTKQCVALMCFFQRRQRASILYISLQRRQQWQESKQQAGREVNKVKQKQGWVRVRDSEKDWDMGLQDVDSLVRLLKNILPLCQR